MIFINLKGLLETVKKKLLLFLGDLKGKRPLAQILSK